MSGNNTPPKKITKDAVDALLLLLSQRGYTVLGPKQHGTAIIYDEIASVSDLPSGITAKEAPASYKLTKRNDRALFGYAVGPYSWKKFLYPSTQLLFKARKNEKTFETIPETNAEGHRSIPRYAFFGVRPCEVAAIELQDKIFTASQYIDPYYKAVREQSFIVAVNCTEAGGTCFCDSMKTGPAARRGFDLALTEILQGKEHYFILETGSEAGAELLQHLPHQPAGSEELDTAGRKIENARQTMGRTLDTVNLKKLLYDNFEHPRWDDAANRCLSCANCTLVCPTCFCSTVEDITDLSGKYAERRRVWDSCFTMDFSYIHGGSIRTSVKARYRQWMTHKLASWIDQFGTSGCVGCGRCITWCPVGIDITEEAHAIRSTQQLPIAV